MALNNTEQYSPLEMARLMRLSSALLTVIGELGKIPVIA